MMNYAQRSIKHCLDMIAPFEATMEEEERGQLEFYQLIHSIYERMYENPEAYLVFDTPYVAYMEKVKLKPPKQKKEKEHVNDARESTLRNAFQQAIQFYATYFYRIGVVSQGVDETTGEIIVRKNDYEVVLAQMERLHTAKYNPERYEVLVKHGLQIKVKEEEIRISHLYYKEAMKGLLFLCEAPEGKYKWMNYLRLDYKNAYAKVLSVEDICKSLSKESEQIINHVEEQLNGLKIKKKIRPLRGIVSDFKWKVEYVLKGKNVFGFYADQEYLMLCVYFNDYKNINAFSKVLLEEDQNLFQWFKDQFPERLCICPSNRRVNFGDENRRICGLSNRAEIVNPQNQDVQNAIFILRKYQSLQGNL